MCYFHSGRALILDKGLPRRDWYKHRICAPGFYTGYGVKTLPGVRDAVEAKNWVGESMARIKGVEPRDASLFTRVVYWFTKRKLRRVPETLKITALSSRLLRGVGEMEMAQAALKSVDPILVALAEIKVAAMVGCPF
jgi:hypothetical protein